MDENWKYIASGGCFVEMPEKPDACSPGLVWLFSILSERK